MDTLGQIIPWVFRFNHVHYARWLSVHLHDLKNLKDNLPRTYQEFLKGHFVTQKTNRKFSLLALAGSPPDLSEKIWEIWDFFVTKYGRNMGHNEFFSKKIWEIWDW